MNLNLGVMPTEADLSSLSDFFPEANIEKLVKIEQFHNKIQKILKDELEESKIKIEGQLNILNERFETIESKLADLKPSMAYSSEFLNTLVDLATKIKDLEKENQAFQERKRLQKDAIDAKKQYQERTKYTIHSIEGKINNKMKEISEFISGAEHNPPILRLESITNYDFETPRDNGTGTNYKGMLIYDFSMLELTPLPAIAHDSLLFPYMSNNDISNLIKLYSTEQEKQIFIAFDRYNSYGKEVAACINDHTVIRLGEDEKALFGRQWGKIKSEQKNPV